MVKYDIYNSFVAVKPLGQLLMPQFVRVFALYYMVAQTVLQKADQSVMAQPIPKDG